MNAQLLTPDQWGPELFQNLSFRTEDLDLLRAALIYLKDRYDLAWAEIERQAEIPRRRVERFVALKRRPKDHRDLIKMAEWVADMLRSRASPLTRALKSVLTIDYNEVNRIWNAYAGKWMCVSKTDITEQFYSMALHIFSAPERHCETNFPLPKFTLELGSDNLFNDWEESISHRVDGYIQLRDKDLYFAGQSMWEPRGRLGFMVFADQPERNRRNLMSGWGLLPTLDRSSPTPRYLAATRMEEAGSIPIGRLNEDQCLLQLPDFRTLVQRLQVR